MNSKIPTLLTFLLFFNFATTSHAQQSDEKLTNSYEDYSDAPREVAYVHLNKSVYVEGEMLGFSAYVFDKFTKERSLMTSNLYCGIYDNDGNAISEKLVFMLDGVANNVFNIDSTYTKKEYTFKAYTNYMLNFDEQNHYEQKFRVINADLEEEIKFNSKNDDIELQILPEGGHIVSDIFNTVGIIAKDNNGFGISNAKAQILDSQNNIINEFLLNEVGLGKTIFKPKLNEKYFLKVESYDYNKSIHISDIKPTGIAMSVTDLQTKISINFKTNTSGLELVDRKVYKLGVHNGDEIKIVPFSFNNELEVNVVIDYSNLFSGMNIFTLFDENNNPLLERLFFNYQGIQTNTIENVMVSKNADSLKLKLKLADVSFDKFNSLSISVLPSGTKSYTHHNNILSSVYLQPYLRGPIENGGYYFSNPDRKTKFNLDLLLLTQGWSSYSWSTIFKGSPLLDKAFERGIDVVATVNDNEKGGTYLVYPLKNNNTEIFELKSKETKFSQSNLVPIEDEYFQAGFMIGKGKTKAPGLYPRFHPSGIPKFNNKTAVLNINFKDNYTLLNNSLGSSWERMEILEEIVLEGSRKNTKAERLKSKSINVKISIINDSDRMSNMRLSVYLNRIGWIANEFQGRYNIINPRVNWGPNTPLVYLDDALLLDYSILSNMNMEIIDYIESDLYGLGGGGIRGSAGFIKIYTDPSILNRTRPQSSGITSTKFPLTFSANKTFYAPVYQFYNTSFFKEYGVINWFPNQKPADDGTINLSLLNIQNPSLNLYIEGITNDNQFVSEVKTIAIE
ncbi:hypothetical protein [Paucihalobacter sp.]|uniref:hypothetical protein n=1 Tax=Paucihalobacter sp. TaxID=2850405 RepID=UPI002FE26E21